jgi:hypothetical protein
MGRYKAVAALVVARLAIPTSDALAEDTFHRLRGSRIPATFAGMELTDEVHWSQVYGRDGTLTTYEMGSKRIGKWRVRGDELCLDQGKDMNFCYEVWISRKKVELRHEGTDMPLEGVLGRPAERR